MKEKYGIEELKNATNWAVDVVGKIIKLVEKSKKGKRVTGWDSIKFIKPLFKLIALVGEHKQLGKEWGDLSEDEKVILNKLVKDGLEIEDSKKSEEIAERIFYLSLEIGDFITDVTK